MVEQEAPVAGILSISTRAALTTHFPGVFIVNSGHKLGMEKPLHTYIFLHQASYHMLDMQFTSSLQIIALRYWGLGCWNRRGSFLAGIIAHVITSQYYQRTASTSSMPQLAYQAHTGLQGSTTRQIWWNKRLL